MTTASILRKHQVKVYGPRKVNYYGQSARITAEVRYDDRCGNGHNTFAITGEIIPYRCRIPHAFGCLHEYIAKAFPELRPFIKWHLCSSDGPLHYLANTLYHARQCEYDHARHSAIWPDATREQLEDKLGLMIRLPDLLREFRAAVESLGFVY